MAKQKYEPEKAVKELSKKTVAKTAAKTTEKVEKKKVATVTKPKPTPRKVKAEPATPAKVKTQRFTVDFPEDRYFEFKMEALRRRTTVKNMLLEAMKKTYGI